MLLAISWYGTILVRASTQPTEGNRVLFSKLHKEVSREELRVSSDLNDRNSTPRPRRPMAVNYQSRSWRLSY